MSMKTLLIVVSITTLAIGLFMVESSFTKPAPNPIYVTVFVTVEMAGSYSFKDAVNLGRRLGREERDEPRIEMGQELPCLVKVQENGMTGYKLALLFSNSIADIPLSVYNPTNHTVSKK